MYHNVKHLMVPIKPIEPAQVAWIECTAQLVVAYSTELHGECPSSQELDSFFIQTAAELIWTTTGGKPCWSDLDVDEYIEIHSQSGGEWQGNAALTLVTFLRWMVDCGHLERALATAAIARLDKHVDEWLRSLGFGALCSPNVLAALPN